MVGSKEKEKLLGSFTTLRDKFRNFSQKTRGRLEGNRSPRGGPTLKIYTDEEGGRGDKEEVSDYPRKGSSEGVPDPVTPGAGHSRGHYSSGRSDSFGRGVRPTYPRHSMKRSESDDTISSQSTLVPRTSLLDSDDHPIADILRATMQPMLTQSQVWAHDKSASSRHRQYRGYRSERRKAGKEGDRGEEEEEEGKEDDRRTIEGGELNSHSVWPCEHSLPVTTDSTRHP